MMDETTKELFARALDLGVVVNGYDLDRLLEAVHIQESELMLLRHAIERQITGVFNERR
jgi:hypothetical protein